MIVYIYNIGVDLYNGFNGLRHRINWIYFTVLDGLAHPLYSIQGHYKKYMKKLSKVDLLILDEFLLTTISECERNDLFEVIQSRTDKKSTIYCSQWAPEGWLGKLGDGPLADAILDRIRNSSYTILLKGRSLREDYSKIR